MDDQIINFVASAYVNEMAEDTGFWDDHYLGGIYAVGASLGHIQINEKGEQWVTEAHEALQSRNSPKRVAMQIKLEEVTKRFKLDENSAALVKDEVESFSDWINEYGPVIWFSGESVDDLELDSLLVWTPQSGNDECISNGYEDSDYPDVLREGYFVATEPCDEEPYSVFVTTGLWIDCTSCIDGEVESEDCDLCDGNQCFLLDILELFDEIQVQQP